MNKIITLFTIALLVGCNSSTSVDSSEEPGVAKLVVTPSCDCVVRFGNAEPKQVRAGEPVLWRDTRGARSVWGDQTVVVNISVNGSTQYTYSHFVAWGTVEKFAYTCK